MNNFIEQEIIFSRSELADNHPQKQKNKKSLYFAHPTGLELNIGMKLSMGVCGTASWHFYILCLSLQELANLLYTHEMAVVHVWKFICRPAAARRLKIQYLKSVFIQDICK